MECVSLVCMFAYIRVAVPTYATRTRETHRGMHMHGPAADDMSPVGSNATQLDTRDTCTQSTCDGQVQGLGLGLRFYRLEFRVKGLGFQVQGMMSD